MIPGNIREYLERYGAHYEPLVHERAIGAQELAASLHVGGRRVAKVVVLEGSFGEEHEVWLAVLPATHTVDIERLRSILGATELHLMSEEKSAALFEGSEVGAEPPFGRLYHVPVVVDDSLAEAETIVFHAGSHTEAIEMEYNTFAKLETPRVADFTA